MRRPRSRLALRIYLVGLLQIGVVLLGFVLLARLRVEGERAEERAARVAVDGVIARLGDPDGGAAELDRVLRTTGATITIYERGGRVVATNRADGDAPLPFPPPGGRPPPGLFPPPPPPPPDQGMFAPSGPVPAFMFHVRLPDGRPGRALYAAKEPRSASRDALALLGVVLVVVGVASLLTARSIAMPLAELSRAARAFGAGELAARAGLARSDEIGDVSAAFDEMAERITSLLRAEKELLANVSHELRTPLARIRVALDLAAEGDASSAREALAEIAEDLGELERLISDVLTAARLDLGAGPGVSGIPPLREEQVDLRALLEHAASRFRSAHADRPLEVALEGELPAAFGDAVLLRRAVDNLLENAHRYSRNTGDRVDLAAVVSGGEVQIEVLDRGVGIAPEDLPHVFRPFFRADRSRARATGGLGLGLALTRRIVEAHEGSIALEARDGGGTRAILRLPVAKGG